MTALISVDRLSKVYGKQVALDEVSFEVEPGTVFALLGENGAGKTTAIRLLLGMAEPSGGQARVFGLRCHQDSLLIRRRVGYVAERPTLYDWMKVDEIGWFTAGFYHPGYLDRYRKLIEQFQVPNHKKLKTLSKGMLAKVSLALAMGHDPELLILDEPTSGLDALVRREFLESMVDRAAEGKTVFLSSHQIHEVERVADVVAIMRQGKLIVVDRLEKLKAETAEITLTMNDPNSVPPPVGGEILRTQRRSRQWQLLVRHATNEALNALADHAAINSLETRTPNLEEIFVAYMQQENTEVDVRSSDQPMLDHPPQTGHAR